jgi:hypothetical protein
MWPTSTPSWVAASLTTKTTRMRTRSKTKRKSYSNNNADGGEPDMSIINPEIQPPEMNEEEAIEFAMT